MSSTPLHPLQYSCLENPMDGGAWQAAVHGVTKSQTRLSDFTFTFHCHALEKEMATHSSVLAWRIPGTGDLVGCHLWGRTESDTTEVTQQQQQPLHRVYFTVVSIFILTDSPNLKMYTLLSYFYFLKIKFFVFRASLLTMTTMPEFCSSIL